MADVTNRGFFGRRALVTGAAMGIGRAVAMRLASEGAALGLVDISPDVASVAEELTATGAKVHFVRASVASTEQVNDAVAKVVAAIGGLDVVINNAGITRSAAEPTELPNMGDDEWDAVHEVNLKGTFRVTRAALPHLREADHKGVICCVSSVIGSQQGWATRTHYAASKAGVEGFVRALAVEVARDGIRVVAVAPGLVESQQTLDSAGPDALREWASGVIPLGSIGQPDDIAALIAFLCSDEARYLTGVVLTADGGMGIRSVNPLPKRHPVSNHHVGAL